MSSAGSSPSEDQRISFDDFCPWRPADILGSALSCPKVYKDAVLTNLFRIEFLDIDPDGMILKNHIVTVVEFETPIERGDEKYTNARISMELGDEGSDYEENYKVSSPALDQILPSVLKVT